MCTSTWKAPTFLKHAQTTQYFLYLNCEELLRNHVKAGAMVSELYLCTWCPPAAAVEVTVWYTCHLRFMGSMDEKEGNQSTVHQIST